jgi:sugar phosphate isomerase/epimerase
MKNMSRRTFVGTGALAVAAFATSSDVYMMAEQRPLVNASPIRLGLASYTFREFSRAQMIGFMKQLNVFHLNAKDVKDHLPMDRQEEAAALGDYAAADITLHAAGAIYFAQDESADIKAKFEYCKRAGINVIVAGDPTPESLPRIENLVKAYDIRVAIHNHGPEDRLWHSPLDVLNAVKRMDPRIGCCMDVGHAARAGTDIARAIHEMGPRLFNVHMKDLANFVSRDSQVAVGDGIIPVREMFQAMVATEYKGFVDLEYEIHPDDPMLGVTSSFAYMRGMLKGMGYTS